MSTCLCRPGTHTLPPIVDRSSQVSSRPTPPQEVGKMLSKALKVSPLSLFVPGSSNICFLQLSFTREVEVIASTLQPASTVHTFSFTLPAPSTPLAPSSMGLLRSSVLSGTPSDRPVSNITSLFPYHDPFSPARLSSLFLGPPGLFPPSSTSNPGVGQLRSGSNSGTPDAPPLIPPPSERRSLWHCEGRMVLECGMYCSRNNGRLYK